MAVPLIAWVVIGAGVAGLSAALWPKKKLVDAPPPVITPPPPTPVPGPQYAPPPPPPAGPSCAELQAQYNAEAARLNLSNSLEVTTNLGKIASQMQAKGCIKPQPPSQKSPQQVQAELCATWKKQLEQKGVQISAETDPAKKMKLIEEQNALMGKLSAMCWGGK